MLCHYEVNQITGEKFLRIAIREWKTSYDPEIVENKKDFKRTSGVKNSRKFEDDKEFIHFNVVVNWKWIVVDWEIVEGCAV